MQLPLQRRRLLPTAYEIHHAVSAGPAGAPRLGWLAGHIDPELCFATAAEAVALAERLATDDEFHALHAKRAHASTADFTPALVAARYLEALS